MLSSQICSLFAEPVDTGTLTICAYARRNNRWIASALGLSLGIKEEALQKPLAEIIGRRYSCRMYKDNPIGEEHRRLLSEFLASNRIGPLGTRARFSLVAATEQERESLKGLGTYGVIKGATGFIVGATERGPKELEDYGYLMEHAVLFATDLGLGTCWLGGTFSKSAFAKKIGVTNGEIMPAVTAVGYAADGSRSRDPLRRRAGSDERLPADRLFFGRRFEDPIPPEHADGYLEVLEAVRWAPSASNRQPWRIVQSEDRWHFYLRRTKGYGKGSLIFSLMQLADLQRVDMGIAMCHFELTARERGLAGHWVVDDPRIEKPDENTEYTASWRNDVR